MNESRKGIDGVFFVHIAKYTGNQTKYIEFNCLAWRVPTVHNSVEIHAFMNTNYTFVERACTKHNYSFNNGLFTRVRPQKKKMQTKKTIINLIII